LVLRESAAAIVLVPVEAMGVLAAGRKVTVLVAIQVRGNDRHPARDIAVYFMLNPADA
jgi:hypothetical protein